MNDIMSKKQETALNIYTLIFMNIVFWISCDLPRKIVNFDDISSVTSYIFHLIFWGLFSFFIIISFAKDKNIFSENVFDKDASIVKRLEVKKWFALLFLQLGFDCTVGLLSSLSAKGEYLAIDILIPLYWFSIYFICVGTKHLKKENFKIFIFEFCFVLCLTVCSVLITNSLFADYVGLTNQYQSDSPILLEVKTNAEFLYSLKILVLDTLIGVFLLIMNRVLSQNTNKTVSCSFGKFFVRMDVIGAVLCLCIFLRLIYSDQILLAKVTNHSAVTSYTMFGAFKVEQNELVICPASARKNSESSEDPFGYQKTDIMVSIDGVASSSFTSRYSEILYPYRITDQALEDNYLKEEFSIDQAEILIYNSQVICFYENDVPRIIKMTDIRNSEESEILIAVCEKLLSEGNIYIFEYAADYLDRYAPDFIEDYIERYANGDFTESESLWMQANHYRDTYVIHIAKQYAVSNP